MSFRFGEWYSNSNVENYQISNYETLSLPLSYLYIMMVAVDSEKLVSLSGSAGFMINVIENFAIDKELETPKAKEKKPVSDIKSARWELEKIIDNFHESILEYSDALTEEEDKLGEKET